MSTVVLKPEFDNEPHRQQDNLERRLRDDRDGGQARSRRLGDTLIAMGMLKNREIKEITRQQEKTGEPFGNIAISKGYLKPDEIQAALGVQFGFLRESEEKIQIPDGLTILRRPHSKKAEQMRLLRTRLLTSCTKEELQNISIIDVDSGSASIQLAANLGAAFAQMHRRVLVVDTNLRMPKLNKFFRLKKKIGLADYLSGKARYDDVIQESLVARLDIVTVGQRSYNPQVLLSSENLDNFLQRANKDYDSVILLSAEFGPIADGQFVWQKSSSAMVVVRKNHTREDNLKQLAATLYDLQTPMLGAIVAK